MARVLIIADTQNPFNHSDYLEFLIETKRKYRTDIVVHVGDEIDHHALGDYDTDPDGYSAGHELQKAIDSLKPYYKAFPEVYLCESNHRARILKKAFKSGIPVRYMKEFKEVIEAPSAWHWKYEWEIDHVKYIHGMGYSGSQGAINAAKDFHKNCVIGHLHSDAGILFFNNGFKTIWGMNVGSGINQDAYAFNYAKDSRKKAIVSCGVVIDQQPHVILMK